MNIKVTTLVENSVKGRGLLAEHGLSILIEANGKLILFDTGASDLFINNANVLSKNIEEVDYLILSHGHSDHTGGLKSFLNLNTKAQIICKREILTPKFRGKRENGICDIENIDLSRFIFIDKIAEITKDIFVIPNIKIINTVDTHFSDFEIKTEKGRIPDIFDDELFIVIKKDNKISLLSACSHRGITNIITSAREYFPLQKIKYLVGGFHLVDSLPIDTQNIIEYLKSDIPESIGVCHCTGLDSYTIFKNKFNDKVFYNYCGTELYM
ncbi:MAG: MBL fold metallo-hydrolase [Bacteroidales bacterium]|nr:MBL fold metallo-hydrolase [Bacteroidales bacterium]